MAGGDRVTVLVVDDEASIRLLCRVNLELEGYRVLEAATLGEARDALAAGAVEVVLLDVHVGHEDGRDLLTEIRADRPELPVAFFSGTAERETLMRSGADGLIPKPFALDELVDMVGRLTGAKSDRDSSIA
jgi:DNA-binding response OmpR family regulator